ncbi:MAG: flagellin, partial [Mucispirillum sp.]|nr:flagellin [Mucispirillum sp.]
TSLYATFTTGATYGANDLVTVGSTTAGVTSFTGKNEGLVMTAGLSAMKVTGTNFVEMEVTKDFHDGTKAQGFTIQVRTRDAATGVLSDWEQIAIDSAGKTVGDSKFFSAGVTLFDTANASTDSLKEGDRILAQVSKGTMMTAGDVASDIAAGITEYGTVKIGENGATVVVRKLTDADTRTTTTFYTAQMDEAGKVYYGQMDMTFEKGSVVTGSASIDILGAGDVASKYTKLSQLDQFTNADGRMVLDNTQEISIYAGNGKTAKVTLEGSDTIADLENKLTAALVEQLGMGADATNPNATEINSNLVKFVETQGTGDRAVKGTFVIQGAVLGDDSNLTFVGDEGVLNALGVTQIQAAQDSALNVRVTDAHTGEFIGEDTVTDGRLRNIIQGVDIDIKPESAANISFDADTNTMKFLAKGDPTVAYLHIKDNSTRAAIGANEGQTLDISIGRLDTKSMGIDGITVATFDDAQKAITKLDMALEQISKARATAGAQMNRLEYTINNLNTTRENMVAAESRIRDLDIAVASTDLAAQQVVLQSATAMLAQANQIPSYAMQLLG